MEEIKQGSRKSIFPLGQDWATVIGGFGLIFLVLFTGYKIKIPTFGDKIGLLFGNIGNLRSWLSGGAQTELFVKIGLVLLGATILLSDLLSAGSFGLILLL